MNTVIHLQHFFEIKVKMLLKVANIELKPKDGFYNALQALYTSVKHKHISDEVAIITKYKDELELLNTLRNDMLHAGSKIIKYSYLDKLMSENFCLSLMI